MKLLHVCSDARGVGGRQIDALCRSGGEHHVAMPGAPAIAGATCHELPGGLRGVAALRDLARRVGADVVLAHDDRAVELAILAGLERLVATRRSVSPPRGGALARLACARPTGWIVSSQRAADGLVAVGVPTHRIACVPDVVPRLAAGDASRARSVLGAPADAPLVVALGPLEPGRGHHALVEAAAWIDEERHDVWLAISGNGSERQRLADAATHWELHARTVLCADEVRTEDLLAAASVFVEPSVDGSHDGGVVHAMRAGVAVVSTSAGDLPELIDDMRTGVLVAPADGAALARAIAAALRGRQAAAERADHARAACGRLEPSRIVEDTLAACARFV